MKRIFFSTISAGLIAALGVLLLVPSAPLQAQGPTCSVNSSEVGTSAASANTVLILQPTVDQGIEEGGCSSEEALQALALGYNVEVATAGQWGLKTQTQFKSYRALILGDPDDDAGNCSIDVGNVAAAEANTAVWGAAATGNIVVIGTDPVSSGFHTGEGQTAGVKLTKNAIAFAASLPTQTGVYVSLSCYYFGTTGPQTVDVLSHFGAFNVLYQETNRVQINDPTHPVVSTPNALTSTPDGVPADNDLSDWGSSIHEQFTTFPDTFTVVASDAPLEGSGLPYILARGRQQSITTTFTPTDTTETFVRDPNAPHDQEVSATLTFQGSVLQPFNLKFTFTTVSKMAESARLDPSVFGAGAQCLSYDSDAKYCVRHTVRLVDNAGNDIGVPLQDVHFDGNFRLELGFHDVDVKAGNIGAPFLAEAIEHNPLEIESPVDLYDKDILTAFRFNSCNCVGVAETDGFSDFIMGERVIPAEDKVTFIGPLPPIKLTPPLLVLKAGQALPVKFRLTDSTGAFITSGVTAMLDIWQIDPSTGQILSGAVNRAGTEFVFNFSTNVWERITDTAGWPKGDYVGVIRSVYDPPDSTIMFSPVKFNFSVKK